MHKFLAVLWMLTVVYATAVRGQGVPVEPVGQPPMPQASPPAMPPAVPVQVPQPQETRVAVDLTDGSRIIGKPSADHLKMTTDYADMEIRLAMVGTIDFPADANGAARVKLRNGDLLTGRLGVTSIGVKTIFGEVTLPLAGVRSIRVSAGGAPGVMPEGLVLHYTFDTDGDGKVADASSAGNDGAVQGATYVADGRKGAGAMSFSGDHQAVMLKNSASLQLQDFTIVLWMKRGDRHRLTLAGLGTDAAVFAYGQGGYGIGIKSQDNSLFLSKIGIDNVSSQFFIRDEAWHQVAVSKSGSKVVFYLDGTASAPVEYNEAFEFNTDVAVGARGDSQDNSFIGQVNEVEVFKRALSEDEVKGIYDSQK